jgi:hypothetical protein
MKHGTDLDIPGSAPPKYVIIVCASCAGVRTRKRLNEVEISPDGATDYTCINCGDWCAVEGYEPPPTVVL